MKRSVWGLFLVTAVLALAGCGHRHYAHAKAQHGCDAKPPAQQQQPAAQQPGQTEVIVVVPSSAPAPEQ